ncbi:alpha/beta hydrolase [Alteromonas sp. MMG017]|uniref:alpha/beta hydrolase n=1 Tax=Alteromonas sp. MMG017 TaxID=2822692 RepID=UPI001B3A526B|nr:alpha/beta hydrolase [Alteromonas sp. MMG017]MBQ4828533.1 alpha/beta hydrolase [Alteromonas sp. MMG017]
MKFILILLFVITSVNVHATATATANEYTFPSKINAAEHYVFYSHGYIVEGDDPTPIHPRWGVYNFPSIQKALNDASYTLIAHHRPKGVSPIDYAKRLAGEVKQLITFGVPPENITLTGFSRGGAITILAVNELKNAKVNVVILAGCAGLINRKRDIQLYGRVLSIYETSDDVGSCNLLEARSPMLKEFKEIAISTGKEHGAFYRPIDEWLVPLKQWINSSISEPEINEDE